MKPIQVGSNTVAPNTRITQRVPSITDKAFWNVTPCSLTDTYRRTWNEFLLEKRINPSYCNNYPKFAKADASLPYSQQPETSYILSQTNPIRALSSYLFAIYLNVLPSPPTFSERFRP